MQLVAPAMNFLDPELRRRVAEVAMRYELDLVVLFGSRAKGTARMDSDADIAVRGARQLEFRRFLDLTLDLEAVLSSSVDLVDLSRADPLLQRQISDGSICLFETQGSFDAMRLRALHAYEDYSPFLRLERTCVRRALGLG
jgi:predicted nucleotidyltransferase